MAKRSRTEKDSSSDNVDYTPRRLESEHVALQADYVKYSALATQGFMEHVMHETSNIDVTTADFAESDLDFEGIARAMKYSGPEEDSRSLKVSSMLHTAEGVLTMTKVAEVFLMDLALKAWQARDIETPAVTSSAEANPTSLATGMAAAEAQQRHDQGKHAIHGVHLQRAIRTHEEFDFLADTAYSFGFRDRIVMPEAQQATRQVQLPARGGIVVGLPVKYTELPSPPPAPAPVIVPKAVGVSKAKNAKDPWRTIQPQKAKKSSPKAK
jgi:hypothetical protein